MKTIALMILMLAGFTASAQQPGGPVRYQYEPGINEQSITGKITAKFIAYKDFNPVYFFLINKKQVHVWQPKVFYGLAVGEVHTFVGIVPLTWTPDYFRPVPEQEEAAPGVLAADKIKQFN